MKDPKTGLSIRFIRNYDPKEDALPTYEDAVQFHAIMELVRWRQRLSVDDVTFLRSIRVAP